jgi:adenylate kinase
MVLFVDEAESVARQLKRGRQVVAHNEEVTRSGGGELWEERATDSSETLARNRYRVFKEQTYVRHARQDLVRRLDGYEVELPETFGRVIEFIEAKMMPIVVRHAMSGVANINSEDVLFQDPVALAMM